MLRQLLTPRWLIGLVVALAGAGAMLRLGQWQLSRGQQTSSLQNYAYALEWALFAAFTLYCFYRFVRDAGRPADESDGPQGVEPAVLAPRAAPPAPPTEDEDPELAAYNAYLARLNESR